MSLHPEILEHWHRRCDNMQLSTNEFYTALEEAIKTMALPEVDTMRFTKREGLLFSANREYLNIYRNKLEFLVCAAPFGRHFFFSWYLKFDYSGIAMLEWIPFIGKPLAQLALRRTYYQNDTEIMFKDTIKDVVTDVVADFEQRYGRRAAITV